MTTIPSTDEFTWLCLWSRAAHEIISAVPSAKHYEYFEIGPGCGLRSRTDDHRALLLHPSGNGRATGDLTLTSPGLGAHVIPRCSLSYLEYLDRVADAIETAASMYLDPINVDNVE